MIWLAFLLLGLGFADLTRSLRPTPVLPAAVGGVVMLVVPMLCGVLDLRLLVCVVLTLVVVAWAQLVDRGAAAAALLLGGVALVACLVVALPQVSELGWFERWLAHTPMAAQASPERALLLLGVGLAMVSTGNVVVRLTLQATGTVRPGGVLQPSSEIKGGRILGPMERLFILGLGLSGNLTAAGIVIAAKGLIRWPELQSKRERGADIDEITEYFLVGSFLSWMIALAGVLLVAGSRAG